MTTLKIVYLKVISHLKNKCYITTINHRCLPQGVIIDVCSLVYYTRLVDEAQDLTRDVLSSSLFVVHDPGGGGQDDVTELTGGQQVVGPSFNVTDLDVESGRDDTALVQSTVQLNDDLARSVVVDVFEFTDVAVLLHDGQELDDDLRRGSDHHLSLTGLFGVVDSIQGVSQNGSSSHLDS